MVLGWGLFSLGVKQIMHGADRSPPSSATVTDFEKSSHFLITWFRGTVPLLHAQNTEVHNTVRHKFPSWNNFDRLLLEIKLQTQMWE